MSKKPELFTTGQVAEQLNCDDSTIRRWCRAKDIGFETPTGRLLNPKEIELLRSLVQSGKGRPPKN